MCSLCRIPVARNHNFAQILTFLGAPVPTPFYRWGSNLVCYSSVLHAKFWANFDFLGAPVPTSFDQWGPNSHCMCLRAKFCLDRFILSPSVGKKTQFLPFFGLRHLVLSPIGNSLTKLNTGAQLQTFPYPTASKLFLYSNAFMAKLGAQSLTFKSVTNKQTNRQRDRQTKKLNVFGHPDGGWNPSPIKLGTVIEDLEHVLSPLKRFVVWRILSPLGGAENLGHLDTLNLKPPITP